MEKDAGSLNKKVEDFLQVFKKERNSPRSCSGRTRSSDTALPSMKRCRIFGPRGGSHAAHHGRTAQIPGGGEQEPA